MEMYKPWKISAAAAARKFVLFPHFVCKYHLKVISKDGCHPAKGFRNQQTS